jgi:curved DNA-binding protein CbpA
MDLIEFSYGPNTNIYEVLQVDQDASQKEIQSAFMARRLELYGSIHSIGVDSERIVTGKDGKDMKLSEKAFVEKKMDALVAVFRILRDPRKRRKYDAQLNKGRAPQPQPKPMDSRSSPRSLIDFDDSFPEVEESLTDDLTEIQVSSSIEEDKENTEEEEKVVAPVKGRRRFRKLKGSGSSVVSSTSRDSRMSSKSSASDAKSISSRKSKSRNKSDDSLLLSKTSAKSSRAIKDSSVPISKSSRKLKLDTDISVATKPSASVTGAITPKSKRSMSKKSRIPSINEEDDEDDVEKFYEGVVTRKDTTLGSWLRKHEYLNQANAVDDAATEVAGSAADIWLSISQIASAFSVDERAIDNISYSIDEATTDLTSGNY